VSINVSNVTVPPVVSITAPVAGVTISGKSVSLAATAQAAQGLSIVSLQFKLDGIALGSSISGAGPYTLTLDTTTLTNGAHALSASAIDSSGVSAVSPTTSIAVNNPVAPPSVSIATPVAGATVAGSTLVIAASASAAGTRTIASVQFLVDASRAIATVTSVPYQTTLDTTTLTDGAHTLTAIALDSGGAQTTSAGVAITVKNSTSTVTAFVSGGTFTTLRNNASGLLGMQITVGSQPIAVTSLGRLFIAGNSKPHLIKLVNAATNADVPGASVTLNMTGGTAGQFKYASLTSPVTLAAGSSYYLVSQEWGGTGNDTWYDYSAVTTTGVASIPGAIYNVGSGYVLVTGKPSYSYVPVNFQYNAAPALPPPSITITAPANGSSISGKSVPAGAIAAAATGLTISNVQFKVDGSNIGIALPGTSVFNTTLDSTTLTNGSHSLTAVATDSAGNTSTSSAVTVTVNNISTPPVISITAPASGATVSGTNLTVTATGSVGAGTTVASMRFKVDGNAFGSALTGSGPYSATLDTTTLSNGAHTLTAVLVDSSGGSGTSSPVAITVANAAGPSPLITGQTFSTARNNWSGFAGMQFTVGANAITVTQLGRIYIAGNNKPHTIKLVDSTGTDVPNGSVKITMSSATAANTYQYGALASPVVLKAGATYYLVCQEWGGTGNDYWYDYGPVTASKAVTVNGPVYNAGGVYNLMPAPSNAYVPLNLIYQ
jgi:hypothetical protein